MTNLYQLSKLPSAERIAELNRLLRANRMIDGDLALTLGVSPVTVKNWLYGLSPVPNPALVTLAALERLPVEEREQLIFRRPRTTKAAATRQRLAAAINARPPLSAKQAGASK
jgi:hypothetical protein